MTSPLSTPQMAKFEYTPAAPGLALPVSHGTVNTWVSIPWNVEVEDASGQHTPNGWTVLNGPCLYVATAFVKVKEQQAGCSLHLMPRIARRIEGENVIVHSEEATEFGVLDHESHPQPDGTVTYSNTHLHNPTVGRLEVGERLQFVVDYWNATAPARIVGGTVGILFWPTSEAPEV